MNKLNPSDTEDEQVKEEKMFYNPIINLQFEMFFQENQIDGSTLLTLTSLQMI
jgi:hypothetical protein